MHAAMTIVEHLLRKTIADRVRCDWSASVGRSIHRSGEIRGNGVVDNGIRTE